MKSTPGPWTVHQNGDLSYSILGEKISDINYKWIIGFVQNGEIWNEQQLANARLIAAAPELLEVLKEIISLSDRNQVFWNKAKEIIKRIEE